MMDKKIPAKAGINTEVRILAQKALDAGYKITPVYPTGNLGAYKEGQDYTLLTSSAWQNAIAVGIILGNTLLVDYDGNKADEQGEYIPPLSELPKILGVDILPAPAQVSQDGRSVHYLFKLPAGVSPGVNILHARNGKPIPFIDLKCGNQILHLKPGKQLGQLEAIVEAPQKAIECLKLSANNTSGVTFEEARQAILDGADLHGSASIITAKMIAQGQSEEAVRHYFEGLASAIADTKGKKRLRAFFDRELSSLITSAVKKFAPPPRTPAFEEEQQVWDDWVFVGHDNAFYNYRTGAKLTHMAFNSMYAQEPTYVGKKKYKPSDYALQIIGIPSVQYMMYAPQFDTLFTYDSNSYVNLYRKDSTPKAATDWSDLCQRHIELLFPNDHKIITQWMAWVVRNPGRKVLWALLLKGTQGDGKTTIARMMKAAMGLRNTKEITNDEIKSTFSGWAAAACLGVMDEIRIVGQNRHTVLDKLKPLITNPEVSIVRKGVDGETVLNTMNYLLTTNHEDALALDDSDRRYGVFFTKYNTRDDVIPGDAAYWDALHDMINNRPEEVRGWLESIDLSGFNPNQAPVTTNAKRVMMHSSRPDYILALEEALLLGGRGVHEDAFSAAAVNELIINSHLGKALHTSTMKKAAETLGYVRYPARIKWEGYPHTAYVKKGLECTLSPSEVRTLLNNFSVFEEE